jgi:V/A-type H+-transporting ATPase subunit E
MMDNLQRLKARILSEAEARAAEMRREAEAKVGELMARAEAEGRDEAATVLAKARVEAEESRRRIITNAQLEARRTLLSVKGQLLSETFAESMRSLQSLDEASYRKLLVDQLVTAAAEGQGDVILNPQDAAKLGVPVVDEANTRLKAAGLAAGLRLSADTRPIIGGFILRSASLEIDNSFEARCRQVRDTFEPEVARLLFKDSQSGTPA